jgi:hypothetical protein
MASFHAEQLAAASEIIAHFLGAVFRYALLLAPCQSGKTGTFHATARRALESGLVDRVILICGSPEKVLEQQAWDDAAEYSDEFLRDGRFDIIFHSSFNKKTFDRRRALIIVDESHLDQGKDQKMRKFLFENGVDLWGTTDRMVAEETFILSVSATPYSELSDIYHGITPRKTIVELTPGAGYKGVGDYWYNGRVHETFDIKEKWANFAQLVKSKGRKWNLVRCYGAAEDSLYAFIRSHASAAGINVFDYTQEKTEVAITSYERQLLRSTKRIEVPCLEDEPAKPSIVLLKGKLRAGKVVPKTRIGFVWEDSKSPNTDTIVQSLLGRMCGYKFGDEMPEIFLCAKMVIESKSLIKQNNLVRHTMMPLMMPMKGRNVKGGALPSAEGHVRHPCVPLLLRFADMEREHEDEAALQDLRRYEDCAAAPAAAKQFLMRILASKDYALIRSHTGLSKEQKAELITAMAGQPDVSIRHLRRLENGQLSNHDFLPKLAEAHASSTCPLERISNDPPFTFCVVHEGVNFVGTELWTNPEAGDVFIYFNTVSKGVGFTGRQALKSRIPQTSGNEIFRCRLAPEEVIEPEAEAGIALRFSHAVCENPRVLKAQIKSVLDFQRAQMALGEDGMLVRPIIKGLADGKVMRLNKAIYQNSLSEMLSEFATEYRVKFVLTRGISTPEVETVKSIRWA